MFNISKVLQIFAEMETETIKEPTTDTMVVVPWGLVCGSYNFIYFSAIFIFYF